MGGQYRVAYRVASIGCRIGYLMALHGSTQDVICMQARSTTLRQDEPHASTQHTMTALDSGGCKRALAPPEHAMLDAQRAAPDGGGGQACMHPQLSSRSSCVSDTTNVSEVEDERQKGEGDARGSKSVLTQCVPSSPPLRPLRCRLSSVDAVAPRPCPCPGRTDTASVMCADADTAGPVILMPHICPS